MFHPKHEVRLQKSYGVVSLFRKPKYRGAALLMVLLGILGSCTENPTDPMDGPSDTSQQMEVKGSEYVMPPVVTIPDLPPGACESGYYQGVWYWWWECDMDPWDGGGGGVQPGGGSHSYNPPPPCDPSLDPICELLLSKEQQELMGESLKKYTQNLNDIPDPDARHECSLTGSRLKYMIEAGKIYAGKYNMPIGHPGAHEAAWDESTDHIHIDPRAWWAADSTNQGKWQLANSILHEVMHSMGKEHPSQGISSPWGRIYSDPWFNRLSPGTNSCLKTFPSN